MTEKGSGPREKVVDLMAALEKSLESARIGNEAWLRERFPEKDWHHHPRTDGRTDLCDGTPSDCASRPRSGGKGVDQNG
jgi:hypothetical protein